VRLNDEKRFSVGSPVSAVGRKIIGTRANAIEWFARGRKQPCRSHAGVTDRKVARFVHRHSVRSEAAAHLNEHADFRNRSVEQHGRPPYAIAPRDRHQNSRLLEVQHDAVRAGKSIQQFFENAIGSQPVDLAAGILQSGSDPDR
jgi:hypothetical protein